MKKAFSFGFLPVLPSLAFVLAGAVATVIACNRPAAFDRNQMLADTAQNAVLPAYQSFVADADSLKASVESFCSLPSLETLAQAQASWKSAQTASKRMEVVSFGPFNDDHIDRAVDFWPTRPVNIEAALGKASVFTAESVDALGSSVQGLPAMEYLLFHPTADTGKILENFTTDPLATARCSLLAAQADHLTRSASELQNAWPGFAESFSQAGRGSDRYPMLQNAINEMVNQMGMLVETVKDTKLGKPMGKASGGDPQPDLVEPPYSGHSIEDMTENLEGLRIFYKGSFQAADPGALSLYDLLKTKDEYVADVVELYIDDAIAALKAMPEPLSESVVTHPAEAENAYQRLVYLKAVIAGQVSGLLGATPYFSDNDGD